MTSDVFSIARLALVSPSVQIPTDIPLMITNRPRNKVAWNARPRKGKHQMLNISHLKASSNLTQYQILYFYLNVRPTEQILRLPQGHSVILRKDERIQEPKAGKIFCPCSLPSLYCNIFPPFSPT